MSKMSIVDIIYHYQKSIDQSPGDEARLIHCIEKLHRLPISVQHLQDTGIGRTVNGLRKYDGEVGVAARTLVMKWKALVAVEESESDDPMELDETRNDGDHDGDNDPEYDYEASNLQVDEQPQRQEEQSDDQDDQINGHESDHRENDQDTHHDRSDNVHHSSRSTRESEVKDNRSSSRSLSKDHKSHDRREKDRSEGGKDSTHRSSSSKSHSSSSSSRKSSSSHGEKDRTDKHGYSSSKRDSSHSSKSESGHSSSKNGSDVKDKHHSSCKVTKEATDEHRLKEESQSQKRSSEEKSSKDRCSTKERHHSSRKEEKEHKRRRPSEEEEVNESKKAKSSDSSKSSGSRRDRSSSSSKSSTKEHSGKKRESSSKIKHEELENSDDDGTIGLDSTGGASFADALSMIGMPSSSKKKSSSKTSSDKTKQASSSMPPPASRGRDDKVSPKSAKSSRSRDSFSPNSTASNSSYGSSSGSYSSTPSLLTQKVKLEPLPEASEIVDVLPVISPHYKPMPLNQTVMECVFSSTGKNQKRTLTEEEALGQSMQSKNLRTKVYSGVKNNKEGVPKLYDLCIRLLQENIDLLDITGGIPFDLLKPVLERASPEQLSNLENYNPYLMEDTDVLWEQHCKRKFRSQRRREEECETWREMYLRCSEERDAKLRSLTHHIKLTQVEKAAPVRRTQLAYVDSAVKPPRNVISKQVKYGTDRLPVVSPAARVASLNNATSNVAKAGDSRLKVAPGVRDTAQTQVFHPGKPRKAPLMAKLMTSLKGFKTGFRR
ncbi:transcription elongation factor B polypeptide 3-like [Toxorhynchites rutilus septentrionalis]|uniref:transcription elongation factor B polypeptide 3-like n=1 Tax=Toxorhynchites rutilus septentrionalis TaxID=329112 RepID=UPI00247A0F23|nr:transcription elongation factor B polypeptide 3-like [Toxorhynchites rutilus septentrionalis]